MIFSRNVSFFYFILVVYHRMILHCRSYLSTRYFTKKFNKGLHYKNLLLNFFIKYF